MKVLVFEYSTCLESSHLQIEGYHMLKGLLTDLNNITEYDVDYLINKSNNDLSFKNCSEIILEEDLISWLKIHVGEYDSVLFIAPEDDYIQYHITKVIEQEDVNLICSNSSASYICTSKDKTYAHISDEILKIPSKLVNIDNINYDKIKGCLDDACIIVKPDDKTSSDMVFVVKNMKELKEVVQEYQKRHMKNFLIQKYINGESVSASIICNSEYAELISINTQEVIKRDNKIIYNGCRSNIKHPLKEKIEKISKMIIKSIPGLKGFVGIDYIIDDEKIYFVEINARLTTPFINLQKNCSKNLTQHIINVANNKMESIEIIKEDTFLKEVKK